MGYSGTHGRVRRARRVAATDVSIELSERPQFEVVDLGNDGDIRIDSPLAELIGSERAHKVLERAILGIAGVNLRLHLMKQLSGVTGLLTEEFPYFEDKVGLLVRQADPEVQEERFDRVVELAGLPSLEKTAEGTTVDVRRLLQLRESEECREFRQWLRGIDAETDAEIQERVNSLRSRAASLVESGPGRVVRFAVTGGAGLIPAAGIVLGPVASAADTFLVDRILGRPGPAAFLGRRYRSIFQ